MCVFHFRDVFQVTFKKVPGITKDSDKRLVAVVVLFKHLHTGCIFSWVMHTSSLSNHKAT